MLFRSPITYIFCLILVGLASLCIAENARYPAKILSPVKLGNIQISKIGSSKDHEQLQDLPIGEIILFNHPFKEEGLERRTVQTCREYNKLKKEEWDIEGTNIGIALESVFAAHCRFLSLLRRADSSYRSYFKSTPLRTSDARFLSADIWEKIFAVIDNQCGTGHSFKDCMDENGGRIFQKGYNLEYADNGHTGSLRPILRADINGDGYEDIAFFASAHAKEGTFGRVQIICLEQKKRRIFSPIDCE